MTFQVIGSGVGEVSVSDVFKAATFGATVFSFNALGQNKKKLLMVADEEKVRASQLMLNTAATHHPPPTTEPQRYITNERVSHTQQRKWHACYRYVPDLLLFRTHAGRSARSQAPIGAQAGHRGGAGQSLATHAGDNHFRNGRNFAGGWECVAPSSISICGVGGVAEAGVVQETKNMAGEG